MSTPPSDPYGSSSDNDRPEQPGDLPSFPGESQSPTEYSAPGYGAPAAAPTPPKSILTAVKLMYVGAGLQALTIVFALLAGDEIREQVAEAQPDLTASELDTAVAIGIGTIVVIGLIAVALWLWMAATNKRGKSWARIVATLLGALNIAYTLFTLTQAAGIGLILQVVTIALAAAILFFLYRSESSEYYRIVSNQ